MKFQLRILLFTAFTLFALSAFGQAPVITSQPESQRSTAGSNVTFHVAVYPPFPAVSSGALRLWLKADAGVVTNNLGFVNQWQDQSGNGNHASQNSTAQQPLLISAPELGGQSVLRFDGIQNATTGDFLQGTNNVDLPGAFTSFIVYSRSNRTILEQAVSIVGAPLDYDSVRAFAIYNMEMGFSAWGNDYGSGFNIPPTTYRVLTERLNTNKTQIEYFDTDGTNNFTTARTTSGLQTPASGYYIAGLGSQTRNFAGDIAELIYFRGFLSDSDRLAVEDYLKKKYYQSGSLGAVAYQWRLNATNMLNATNAMLVLTNVQASDEGDYSVVVSNSFGTTLSSNALLTLSLPPSITSQPQSQEVVQGTNLSFSVAASGVFALQYQWRFNGANISNATNSTLSLTNVFPGNAGEYSVSVSDGLTTISSSNAILVVDFAPIITGQPQNKTAFTGTEASFSITATGYPLDYQWFFNSTNPIAGATNASLILTNIQVGDAGNYSVQVNNNHGLQMSSNAVLTVIDTTSAIFEDFEPGIHSAQWSGFSSSVLATNYGGFVSAAHSLWMGGNGSRFATTRPIDVSGGAAISFYLRLASGSASNWETVDIPGEGVVFEYSLNGTSWTNIGTYSTSNFFNWTLVQPVLPVGAQSSSTLFRWRQLSNSGSVNDHWALDDIQIVPSSSSPTIITQPQSRIVSVGTNVTLNVVVTGQAPLSYQWLLNSSTVLSSATSSLTLTNVQMSDSGNYSVIITNSSGTVTSATAVVTVLTPPSISSQPQNQSGTQGTNLSFGVTASGSAPLSYQWQFNGVAISNAIDSTLLLTNIQGSNAGVYSVRVVNAVGAVVSSNASLTIDAFPVIVTEPQSQSVIAGSNVTFSVGLDSMLPAISSGTLRLWLKADAGVVTNSSGFVSQWQDQSGNTNHASQNSSNLQPTLVRLAAIGNRAAVRFDGIQSASVGDYLKGTGDVGLSNAYTSFMVYSVRDSSPDEEIPAWIGAVGTYGAGRGYYFRFQQMSFATWGYDYVTGFVIPTNTFRIWTDRFNTNRSLIEFFDRTATTSTNFSLATSGAGIPAAGYYVGGFNPSETPGRNFAGDIAELIYFRGSLNETDRLAVENYLKQKYYQSGSAGSVTYQWQFNGTNISGATNVSLTLSNVQPANVGNYSVVVGNSAGSISSANAALTVNVPPSITTQPQTQSVNAGTVANFTVVTAGTEPFSYQWQKNSNNLANATNATLVLNAVQTSDSGNYRVILTSPFGSIISSNAALSVNITTVRVVSTSTLAASSMILPIEISALGTENAMGFSLTFDPSVLTFDSITLDAGLSGAILISNTDQLGSGKLGVAVALSSDITFAAGTQALVQVTFQVGVATNALNTAITFSDLPTTRQVSDVGAEILPALFVDGTVAISAVDFEGDVAPRPNGNRSLTIVDWVQIGRFAAGLDTPTNSGEFQRVDCAPRSTLGNGVISVTDWVQAGRYATGIDPLTPVGGPTAAAGADAFHKKPKPVAAGDVNRALSLETTNEDGQTHVIFAKLVAQGNEAAIGFSLAFDPAVLTFVSATNGGNASGALLNVNTKNLASGRVGVALSLSVGSKFPAGTQEVIKLTFASAPSATGSTALTFADSPVLREVSDSAANSLSAAYNDSSLILSLPGPLLTISKSAEGIVLSWPSTATNFVLESSSSIETNWTSIVTGLTTNGESIDATLPIGEQPQFFRLKK